MFVYQNKAGHICITFKDNKPVETPDYTLVIDKEAETVTLTEGAVEIPEVEETVVAVPATPEVDELDDVKENDHTPEDAVMGEGTETDAPALEDIREKVEGEPESEDEAARLTDADSTGVPSVEELDNVKENDPEEDEDIVDEDVVDEDAVEEDVTEEPVEG